MKDNMGGGAGSLPGKYRGDGHHHVGWLQILGSQKYEYRSSSAESRLKKAEKLGGGNRPPIEKTFCYIFCTHESV
jgi:hypothetical protein